MKIENNVRTNIIYLPFQAAFNEDQIVGECCKGVALLSDSAIDCAIIPPGVQNRDSTEVTMCFFGARLLLYDVSYCNNIVVGIWGIT